MQYAFLMSQKSAARREQTATRSASATETAQNVPPYPGLRATTRVVGKWFGRKADSPMKTTDVHRGSTQVPPETEHRPQLGDISDSPAGVNNFCITVATINGSGSQTANNCLIRALFKMGIPVSGKNIFPSNIQGLPTWFQIRVSEDGFVGRRDTAEMLVAMNSDTAR